MQTADLQKSNRVARRRLWRTSLEEAHRFKAMVEHSHALISFLGHDGTILYGSPSKERILGYGAEELVGTSVFALVHADDLHDVQARFADLLERSGDAMTIELRLRHKDGSWRWMEAVATNLLHIESLRAITVGYRDITGRKRREFGQRLVVEAGSQLVGTLGYERILDRLARLLVPKFAGKCSIYTVERHGRITRRVLTDTGPPAELQRTHPARRVIETGEPRLVWDSLIVPLVVHGRVIGALGVAAGRGARYDSTDLATLEEVGRRCAAAIDASRLLESERRSRALARAAHRRTLDRLRKARLAAELSMPVLAVTEHVILIPLHGVLNRGCAQQLIDRLQEAIRSTRARAAVIDVSGLAIADADAASQIAHAADVARLAGAEVVVTGFTAETSRALVDMGVDLGAIRVAGDLQQAIALASQRVSLPAFAAV